MNESELWKQCCKGDEHHKDESWKLFVSVLKKQMQDKGYLAPCINSSNTKNKG